MKNQHICLLVVLLIAVFSCNGSGSGSSDSQDKPEATANDASGIWIFDATLAKANMPSDGSVSFDPQIIISPVIIRNGDTFTLEFDTSEFPYFLYGLYQGTVNQAEYTTTQSVRDWGQDNLAVTMDFTYESASSLNGTIEIQLINTDATYTGRYIFTARRAARPAYDISGNWQLVQTLVSCEGDCSGETPFTNLFALPLDIVQTMNNFIIVSHVGGLDVKLFDGAIDGSNYTALSYFGADTALSFSFIMTSRDELTGNCTISIPASSPTTTWTYDISGAPAD